MKRGGMRMEQASEATRKGSSGRSRSSPGGPRLRFALAFGLLCVALPAALLQPLRSEPLRAPSAWEWFLSPGETNAFLRAPVVNTELADAAQLDDSDELWVVGGSGIVLRSTNRGATWGRVVLPDVVASPPPARAPSASPPRASWRIPDLIGTAHAGEPEVKRPDVATPPGDPLPGALDSDPYDRPEQGMLNIRQQPASNAVANAPAPRSDEQRQAPLVPSPPPPPPAPHETDLRLVRFVSSEGWIFSAAGHVWRTSDRGQTWSLVSDADAGPQGARQVSFESANPAHAWVATDRGVLETTNGGASWRPLESKETAGADVSDVALLDARRGRIVAGGRALETTDGGARWRDLGDPKLPTLVPDLADDGAVWAFTPAPLALVVLGPDPGASWKRSAWTPPSDPVSEQHTSIAFSAERACVRSGSSLRCTEDGGERWEPHELVASLSPASRLQARRDGTLFTLEMGNLWHAEPGAAASRRLLASAYPSHAAIVALDRRHVLLLAGSVLRSSSDGGKTFATLAEVGATASSIAFRDADHGYLGEPKQETRLSADGGRSWDVPTPRLHAHQFSCRAATCLSLAPDRLARSVGGGPWTDVVLWPEEAPALTLIAQPSGPEPVAWALRADGKLQHSDDDGQSFGERLFDPPAADAAGKPARIESLALVDRRTAFAGGAKLWKTKDAGLFWDVVQTGNESGVVSVSFADAELGFVLAGDGAILRTDDGGTSWTPLRHARTLPPWLALVFGGFVLLLVPWPWQARAPRVETTIADVLASDRPLRGGDLDALRFDVVAEGLADFLKNNRTEPPLTLAITGEWGSGKSSLMNLLKERLEDAGYQPVMFNAWHHQKGEHLFASLYANIREQAIPSWHGHEGLRYRAQLLTERVLERKLLSALVLAGIATFLAWAWQDWSRPGLLLHNVIQPLLSGPAQRPDDFLIACMKALGMVTAPGVLVPVFRALRAFGVDPARLRNSSSEPGAADRVEPGARYRFAREFEQFTRSLRPRTLVVFIDDLDRCSKEHVVEVLEAINFLVVSGPCFIVVAMAEEWVERCVELAFDDLASAAADEGEGDPRRAFARKYLEKLINIRVPIRKPTEAESRALLATMSAQNESRARTDARETVSTLFWRWLPAAGALGVAIGGWLFGGYFLSSPELVQIAAPPPEARGQLVFSEGAGSSGESVELSFPVHAPTANEASGRFPHVVGEIPFGELRGQLVLEEGEKAKLDGDKKQRLLGPFPVAGGARSLSVVIPALESTATTQARSAAGSEPGPPERPLARASVWISKPDTGSGLLWISLPVALGLWIASLTFHWFRREPAVVYDSDEFSRALDAWVPWILAKRDTPRALKRFINHVRYVAMRERAESRSGAPEGKLDEQQLVALASLYHFDRRLVTDDAAFRAACEGRVDAALERLKEQGATVGELASASDAFKAVQAPTIRQPIRERFLAIMADLVHPARPAAPPSKAER